MTRECFIVPFHCSIKDQPFIVRLVREASNEKFFISQIQKVEPSMSATASEKESTVGKVSFDQLSWKGFHCPHCDPEGKADNRVSFFRCGGCNTYVCGANSGRFKYRCRPSCGLNGRWGSGNLQSLIGALSQIAPVSLPVFSAPERQEEKILSLPKPLGTSLIIPPK